MRALIKYIFASIVFANVMLITGVRAAVVDDDHLTDADDNTRSVYNTVRHLFVYQMKTWLSSAEHREDGPGVPMITTCLGFMPETVKLINGAFAILMARKMDDAKSVRVDHLMSAFFDLCHPEQRHVAVASTVQRVSAVLRVHFGMDESNASDNNYYYYEYGYSTGVELTNRLRLYVELTPRPVPVYCGVTVRMMRNSWFADDERDETVNALKKRFDPPERWRTAATEWSETSDVRGVLDNHVEFLGEIVPDLLGFAYNHVQLLVEFRRSTTNGGGIVATGDDDPERRDKPVTFLANFLLAPFDALLKRYWRFRGDGPSDPEDPSSVWGGVMTRLTEFFAAKPVAGPPPEFSLHDYRNPSAEYDVRAVKLIEDVLAQVLPAVGRRRETLEEWKRNRTIRVHYPERDGRDAEKLLHLMRDNTRNAYAFYKLLRDNFE